MKRNKWKRILFLVIAILLVAGVVSTYFIMNHQPVARVIDQTVEGVSEPSNGDNVSNEDLEEIPTQALLSPNVTIFIDEDSKKINSAILSLTSLDSGVEMEVQNGSALDSMGVGDIFFLEGDKNTPFGMTYIGKISAMMPGDESSTYILETPMMDEVFDVLSFSEEGVLDEKNLVAVECVPGVSLMNDGEQQIESANSNASGYTVTPLSSSGSKVVPVNKVEGKSEKLVFDVNIDLAEMMGLKKEPTSEQEQVDFMEAGSVFVYTTTNGTRYHKETCSYLHSSKNKITLQQALEKEYKSCSRCKPPLREDDNGVATSDWGLTLGGYFGLKDVTYSATCNWDIINGGGLEDLYFDVNGVVTSGLKVEGNMAWEIAGRTTQYKLSDSIALEGMKERLFPLAAIHYSVNLTPTPIVGMGDVANKEIRMLTETMPLSVVGIVYVDGQGKISVGFSAYFDYEKPFSYNKTIVKDGKFVYDNSYTPGKEDIDTGIKAEVTADVDFCVGCGLDLYIFNLKVFQLDVAQVGVEAAGEVVLQYTNGVAKDEDEWFEWDAHIRGYFKLLQLKMCLKAKADILPTLDLSFDSNFDLCLWDKTLFEYGKPSGTRFDASTMSYSHITAKDSNAIYYKETTGELMMEKDDIRTILWSEPFFTICGIDETYIYVLENSDTDKHSIRRIAKNGKTSKIVAEDVVQFLTIDEENMYFVSDFDKTAIKRLDRGTEEIDTLANFSKNVVKMEKQDDNFIVSAGSSSFFGGFYGEYVLIDKEGNTISNYGSDPAVDELYRKKFQNYSVAIKIVSSGYLRDTAESVYWVGEDGSNVEIPPLTGWNYFEGGIITMESVDNGYNIVLYKAVDGSKVKLGSSVHNFVLFTTAQDSEGRWYYLDQTEDEVILYTVSPDLSTTRIMNRSPKSDFPVDLSVCSVMLMDGKLYFYTIPDDNSCQVLYRYNIH